MTYWPRQSDCPKLFGNPFAEGWTSKHLVRVVPPYAISMGDVHIPSISINKVAAESLTRVLTRILNLCDHDPKKVAANHCNCFSGSFALRSIRGKSAISMHAFGLAIDFDAPNNALAAPENKTFFKPDSVIVRAFKEENWIWGGDWKSRRDAMHFQAATV